MLYPVCDSSGIANIQTFHPCPIISGRAGRSQGDSDKGQYQPGERQSKFRGGGQGGWFV